MNGADDRVVSQRPPPPPPDQPRRLGAIAYRGEYAIEAWESSREERRWHVRRGDRYATGCGFDAAGAAMAMDCGSYEAARQFVDVLIEGRDGPLPLAAVRHASSADPASAAAQLRAWADHVERGTLSARFGPVISPAGLSLWIVEFVVVPQPATMARESEGGPGPP